MKLLFDQNISYKLVNLLTDIFPDSSHIRLHQLERANDKEIWDFAKKEGFVIVTLDADFAEYSKLYGSPPKVIWLRCGNQPTKETADLICYHKQNIELLFKDNRLNYIELR